MNAEFQLIQDGVLYNNPSIGVESSKIYLSANKLSWITIEWLSEDLVSYSKEHYQELFHIHPPERGKVVMYNAEVVSSRWHRSYLRQPERDSARKRSYMYSGLEPVQDLSLPIPFQKFIDFLNEKETVNKYNQVIVNWYANGKDYIAPHSDCQKGMIPNTGIAILTLCEDDNFPRELRITPKNLKTEVNDNLYRHVKIKLKQGCILTMHGETQDKFRHGITKDFNNLTSRISLTFRMFL
jgi:alkylated DNA repair dioxygenase AlkB